MRPPSFTSSHLLSQHWPLLLQSCSPLPDPAGLSQKLAQVTDPQALLQLADRHGVVAQLSSALSRFAPVQSNGLLSAAVHSARKVQLAHALSLTAELFRIAEIFGQKDLAFLATKGPTLAYRAYGDATARHYADLDLLVRHSDVLRAAHLLSESGYTSVLSMDSIADSSIPGEYIFQRPGTDFLLEIHTERSFRYFPRPLPIADFLQRRATVAMDGRDIPALSLEDEFVLLSVHGAKHFWERLMWIADVAALVVNCPRIDWHRVRTTAAGVGAERMVRVALLLAERTLGVPIPAAIKAEVAADPACLRIVKKIESWLPFAGQEPPALLQRALFRFQMRGRLLAGARYLTRLSLSPTEEDWMADAGAPAASVRDSLRRPFRLARKYGRSGKGTGKT